MMRPDAPDPGLAQGTGALAWVALSDRGIIDGSPPDDLLQAGLLVLEFALPLHAGQVLLNHQAALPWPRTLALFADPEAGLVLTHRQGGSLVRHILPGPLPEGRGTARISFSFDAPARRWSLRYEILAADPPILLAASGRNPLPLQMADVQSLCAQRPAAGPVLWFGVTRDAVPPGTAAWIGLRTPVETSLGPVPAGSLKPGDVLLTADHGPMPLRGATRRELPARGSFAPVLLRAPFFGITQDLLVSADQMVAISGPETEYLFGDEAVLMPAGALVDGRTALSDQRRAVTGSVALDLGTPALIEANGCLLALGQDNGQRLPLRGLLPYEVLTLMTLLGRMPRRAA